MSYSVKLTEDVVAQAEQLSPLETGSPAKSAEGLHALTTNPKTPARSASGRLTTSFNMTWSSPMPAQPRRDALYSFTVRYGADEETLFVVDCELIVEYRAP